MVLARTFLFISLFLIALSSVWTGTDSAVDDAVDAPFECETCTGFEASFDVPLDPHGALIQFLNIAGDPSDPFVVHVTPGNLFSSRPALGGEVSVLHKPEPAWVLLRPPRLA